MFGRRKSGVLLHPTSLPGPDGIGSLGEEARNFVDFLYQSKQSLWQVLPLGPTTNENSPYSCYSAFAGNPLLVDLRSVTFDGDLLPQELQLNRDSERVNFIDVTSYKLPLLRQAASRFFTNATSARKDDFKKFCDSNSWLEDFALFMALKEYFEQEPWNMWPEALVNRDVEAVAIWTDKLHGAIQEQKYFQWQFFCQWNDLKSYANSQGVTIIGDLPIFVSLESSDVWANADLFMLDDKKAPVAVAGVPPDYFSKKGQLWGNPLYKWDRMALKGFKWWIDRLRHTLSLFDVVRVDHFRGFQAFWEIPVSEPAINGRWASGPGTSLFAALRESLGELPIIAEDLGVITPEVEALRDVFGFPGMKILQFAFCSTSQNPYLPHNHVRNCVVYTGTHDNDTTLGWFQSLKPHDQERILLYLNQDSDDIVWHMIRAAFASVADYAVIPMQDLLELPSMARMNTPGAKGDNWRWRCRPDAFSATLMAKLAKVTELYGRNVADLSEPVKDATLEDNDVSMRRTLCQGMTPLPPAASYRLPEIFTGCRVSLQ